MFDKDYHWSLMHLHDLIMTVAINIKYTVTPTIVKYGVEPTAVVVECICCAPGTVPMFMVSSAWRTTYVC